MEIVSNQALISINETAIIQLISFLIFLFVINRLMFRPLRRAVSDRANHIEKVKQNVLDSEKEVDQLLSQLEKRKAAVRDEAFGINKELESDAAKQAETLLNETRQEINAMKSKAERDIKIQVEQARAGVKKEAEILVVSIIERILNRRLAA
jgi:F-type H+-transporting ATPase subunit b